MKKSSINLYDVYDNWRNNSNNYSCYVKSTPFASLKLYTDFEIFETEPAKEESFFQKLLPAFENADRTKLYLIDLPGELNLDLAVMINNELNIKPILSLNHIFHDFGVVGSKTLANALIQNSFKLKKVSPLTYCFILDKNRYLSEDKIDKLTTYNNQYEVTEEDFPDAGGLKQLGISEVIFITDGTIKEDIQCYIEYLQGSCTSVKVVLI